MTIEEINLHQLTAEDLAKYLPPEGCKQKGYAGAKALAEALVSKKVKASECAGISHHSSMLLTAFCLWTSICRRAIR
jgi:CO dehydrogenase/acetyl-CoA synthase gamma subunit (corrinoid Fe-S protein)